MNIRIPMKMEKATNWLTSCSCSSSSVVPTTNIWNGETFIVQLCMTGGLVADAVTTFVRDGDSLFVAGLFWVTIPFGRDRMMSQHRHARPWKPDIWIYDYNLAYTIWHPLLINLKKTQYDIYSRTPIIPMYNNSSLYLSTGKEST